MFRSTLQVAHVNGQQWKLTQPLVWEGGWQFIVIRTGFETDFASIPKPVRWLLDNAGGNAEAAVLHDAAWRESKRANPRIDPWFADGMFRRALRETGAPALTRGLMWFAVRLTATLGGRFGKRGPRFPVKVAQLVGVFLLGVVSALGPTVVAGFGLVVYWLCSWIVALVWFVVFERRVFHGNVNWPFVPFRKHSRHDAAMTVEHLLVVSFRKDRVSKDAPDVSVREQAIADDLRALVDKGSVPSDEQFVEWLAALSVR